MVVATHSAKPCGRGCRVRTWLRRKRTIATRPETGAVRAKRAVLGVVLALDTRVGGMRLCSSGECRERGSGAWAFGPPIVLQLHQPARTCGDRIVIAAHYVPDGGSEKCFCG